jgi:hypothetical protein
MEPRKETDKMSTPPDATTPQQIIAAMLHHQCCKYSHGDYCTWYSETDWEEGTHGFYLKLAKKAENILNGTILI